MMLFVDGIDGSGKSTLQTKLFDQIIDLDRKYHSEFKHVVNDFQFPTRLPEGDEKANMVARTMFHLRDFQETMQQHRTRDDYRIFDRSFVSTLAYQGFVGDSLESNSLYEAILRLGAEAFFSQERAIAGKPYYPQHTREIFFLNVQCAPDVASDRIESRGGGGRNDDVENIEKSLQIKQLELLSERFEIIYMDLKRRLPHFVRNRRFHWLSVDTTKMTPEGVVDHVLEPVASILWPRQQELPLV